MQGQPLYKKSDEEKKKFEPTGLLEDRIVEVCDACGRFIEYWGFKAIHGRVWAYLALHRSPLSQRELATALQVSRSLISMAISELTSYGLVSSTSDHRNAPYQATLDIWPVVSEVLRKREWMLLEEARIALEGVLVLADREAREGADGVRLHLPRLKRLLRMTELAQKSLRLLLIAELPPLDEEKSKGERAPWLERAARWTQQLRGAFDEPPRPR